MMTRLIDKPFLPDDAKNTAGGSEQRINAQYEVVSGPAKEKSLILVDPCMFHGLALFGTDRPGHLNPAITHPEMYGVGTGLSYW